MNDNDLQQRLSQIITHWTQLYQARGGSDAAIAARQELMLRYCGAVYRYLLQAVRDPALAGDLSQEFAVRFLEGRFDEADPTKGRFRNYVKSSLFRLVKDYYRGQQRGREVGLQADDQLPALDQAAAEDQAFRESWRAELLARAWQALLAHEKEYHQPFHTVLRLRVDQPDLSSSEIATRLSEQLGRSFTPANIRQLVHRARERFSELLLDDIRQSLAGAPREELLEELADLNLLKYCQAVLDREQE